MYRIAGRIFLGLFPTIFIIAACLTALDHAVSESEYTSPLLADLFHIAALVLLAFTTHQKVLIGSETNMWLIPSAGSEANNQLGSFFGRFTLLLLPLIVVFALAFGLILALASDIGASGAVLIPLMVTSVLSPFWIAATGTMLPAAAVGGDTTFRTAFKRARSSYWATVGRLFVGPVLFPFAVTVAVTLIAVSVMLAFSISEDDLAALPPWSIFLGEAMLTSIIFFTPLLTATALSMAYQRAEAAQTPPPLSSE